MSVLNATAAKGQPFFEGSTPLYTQHDNASDNMVAGSYSHNPLEGSATEADAWTSLFLWMIQQSKFGGVALAVRNTSGSTLSAGPVKVTGYDVANASFLIGLADAGGNNPAVMLLLSSLANNTNGTAYIGGTFTSGIDTTSSTVGNPVYLAAGGGLTLTAPSGADQIQQIVGRVQTTANPGVISGLVLPPVKTGSSWMQPQSVIGTLLDNNLQAGVNAIINPQGKVAQRRAFSGQIGAPGSYGYGLCDRWKGTVTGATCTAGTLTQDTASPVGNSGYAVRWSGVTATGSGVCIFRQFIESKDAAKFINRNAILSLNVQHDVGSNINFQLNIYKASGGGGKDDFSGTTPISTGSLQSVASATATALNSGAVAMGACGNGILIEVQAAVGAITTKNVWMTDVQFQLGSSTTPCEERAYQRELELCQRHAFSLGTSGTVFEVLGMGQALTATTAYVTIVLPVVTRIQPVPTYTTVGNYGVTNSAGTTQACTGSLALALSGAGKNIVAFSITVAAGLAAGNAVVFMKNNNSSDLLLLDADF